MKKLLLCIMIFFLLCGCSAGNITETTTESSEKYITDANGNPVPFHENVKKTDIDPSLFYMGEDGRMKYSDEDASTHTGIDVSSFQGDIDWKQVAEDGIDFAMIRIGGRGYGPGGIIYKDEKAEENILAAAAEGIDTGVYFFSQAVNPEEAREEARFVAESIKNLPVTYPVAYDWEHIKDGDARTDDMTNEEITACALAFAEETEKSGRSVMIYFNRSQGYFSYDLSLINSYPFWLAEYTGKPGFLYDYKVWQYTEKGSVRGIEGQVDLNISFMNFNNEEREALG